MIHVERLLRIQHAVRDTRAAGAFYEEVLGARKFYEGPIDFERRHSALYVVSNFCVEPVSDPDPSSRVGRFLAEYGERFYSLTLQVEDLAAAEEHLRGNGIRIDRHTPEYSGLDSDDFLGVRYELTEHGLPDDPRLQDGWSPDFWWDEHPVGFRGIWSVSTMVPDLDEARGLYEKALGAEELYTRPGEVASRAATWVGMGSNAVIGLLEPRGTPSDLTKVVEQQGVRGIHALSIQTKGIPQSTSYFRSKGIGLVGNPQFYAMPHPKMCHGARFMLGRGPQEGDPFFDIRARYMKA